MTGELSKRMDANETRFQYEKTQKKLSKTIFFFKLTKAVPAFEYELVKK